MSETRQDSPPDGFDPKRLRTIADMRRSGDDRVVAGVCSGAARYLNVDPVVIRVVIAVLTFVGLAGLIIYLAAWLLLPSDDAEQSIAADWFNLDKNEERVRVAGLVGALVLAALAVVGDSSWAWWGLGWVLIPLAFLYWLFIVRPRRRDDAQDETSAETTAVLPADTRTDDTVVAPKPPKQRGSSALTMLALSVAAIAIAIGVIVAESYHGAEPTTYIAVALSVVTVGTLVGTFFGRPGPLIPIGLLLVAALAIGSLMPSGGMGEKRITPTSAAEVDGSYRHGLGKVVLDLTDVRDPEQLLGSTIRVENGAGDITVTVPDDLNVAVEAEVDGGEIRAFGRRSNGTDAELRYPGDVGRPTLTLEIKETFGGIEVIER